MPPVDGALYNKYVHKDATEGWIEGSVTISLRNFVGEGINSLLFIKIAK
jgi:hypothetical protein